MHSCLYAGRVAHVRREPVIHRFRYSVAYAYIDLDEATEALRASWLTRGGRRAPLAFCPEDHPMSRGLDSSPADLAESVRNEVALAGGQRPKGPVRVLTQFRHAGVYFSPLNLFFCFAPDGQQIEALVAEVSNTPWNERRRYVLDARRNDGSQANALPCPPVNASNPLRFRHAKDFHVSPFMGMAARYAWRVTPPDERLNVAIRCRETGRKPFDAMMTLARQPWNSRSLAGVALRFPLANMQILAAIYWQALRLWTKRCPYVPHPERTTAQA
jgi:DUF1365 family protein